MTEPIGESDAGDPYRERDRQGREDVPGSGLECRARGLGSDQPRWRAITAIGSQWSGTTVCRTPTATTAPTSSSWGASSSGAKFILRPRLLAHARAGGRGRHGCADGNGGCRRHGCGRARERRFRAPAKGVGDPAQGFEAGHMVAAFEPRDHRTRSCRAGAPIAAGFRRCRRAIPRIGARRGGDGSLSFAAPRSDTGSTGAPSQICEAHLSKRAKPS